MSPLHVRSEVCMVPLHVRSKFCFAPFFVWTKDCKLAPLLERSITDFALHKEGSHADFVPHMERRHSFRDQQIAKIDISAIFFFYFQPTYILGIYMICVTTFKNEKCIFKDNKFDVVLSKGISGPYKRTTLKVVLPTQNVVPSFL